MNTAKIDKILQYILLVAGQEDDYKERELSSIHLIKYAYLVDLTYAETHNGNIFTDLEWKFHHFGPWAVPAFQRIEPALLQIGAKVRSFRSQYKEDAVKWSIQDDSLYHQIANDLPFQVTNAAQKYVHQFGSDTETLLHFVYGTWPMLRAKPGEQLDFSIPDYMKIDQSIIEDNVSNEIQTLSVKQRKKREQARNEARGKLHAYLEKKKNEERIIFSPPPYDEIFHEALEVFEAISASDMKNTEGILYFSEDMWKSKARFDPDVS